MLEQINFTKQPLTPDQQKTFVNILMCSADDTKACKEPKVKDYPILNQLLHLFNQTSIGITEKAALLLAGFVVIPGQIQYYFRIVLAYAAKSNWSLIHSDKLTTQIFADGFPAVDSYLTWWDSEDRKNFTIPNELKKQ